jgi:hypothetical protein
MDVMNFNLIGRVENMAEATDRFFRHIGYSTDTVVERRNESGASSVGEYDQELADRVRALYAEDFRRLDYNADDWPAGKAATQPFVSEEKFWDEIVERNLLLSALYREAQRLKAEKDRLDRFHMLKLTSGLSAIRAIARKSALALSRVR